MYNYEKKMIAILLIADTLNEHEIIRLIKKLTKKIKINDKK
jgi:hypothetical protein|tara:strand:- start:780 stop:902 length:123 start_codon:yes stop_codon:yes gene_type:complete